MSDNNNSVDQSEKPETTRRSFLAGGAASAAMIPLSTSYANENIAISNAPDRYEIKGAVSGDPTDPVYFTHALERKQTFERAERNNRHGDLDTILTAELRDEMESLDDEDELGVVVKTLGRRKSFTTLGNFGRELHGFTPTDEEVETLRTYGTVVRVPKVTTTNVSLRGVKKGDIHDIFDNEFVIKMNYLPEPRQEIDDDCGNGTTVSAIDKVALKCDEFANFDGVPISDGELHEDSLIGFIDRGYGGANNDSPVESDFDKNWASDYLNQDKADDHVEWMNTRHWGWNIGDWDYPHYEKEHGECREDWDTYRNHGDNSADLAAYLLDEYLPKSNSDSTGHIVPLRRDRKDGSIDQVQNAYCIESALLRDIPAVHGTIGIYGPVGSCREESEPMCEEIEAYAKCGYLLCRGTRNGGNSQEPVCEGDEDRTHTGVAAPATSPWVIAVGAATSSMYHINDSFERRESTDDDYEDNNCEGDQIEYTHSNFGFIDEGDCDTCAEEVDCSLFRPDIYAHGNVYDFDRDTSDDCLEGFQAYNGTSAAGAQTAAVAAIMQHNNINNNHTNFNYSQGIFRDMVNIEVVADDGSNAPNPVQWGHFIDALEAYQETLTTS